MQSRFKSTSDFFTKKKYPVDIRFREYIEKELNIPRSREFAQACGHVWSVACKMDGSNLAKMSKDYIGNAILQISHAYGKLEPVNQFENFEEVLKENVIDNSDDNIISMVVK